MIEANKKLAYALMKKYNPIEKKDIASLGFKPATLNENKYDHIDGKITFTINEIETKMTVDVKDRKSIKRGRDHNDKFLWVEILNCYGYKGWLYGKADFIAFKQKDHWLVVWRKDLVTLVESKVKKVYNNTFPLYQLKTRKGNKDVITLIDRKDVKGIEIPIQ